MFNKEFIKQSKLIYLSFKHPNSKQFNDLLKYEIKKDDNEFYTSFTNDFEQIKIQRIDNYELLKQNPFTIFNEKINFNDATKLFK